MAEQTSLEYYGDPLVVYKGEGDLTSDSGQVMECEFETGQLRTGEVILVCKFSDIHHLRNINSFRGQTSDNCQVCSTDFIMGIPWREKIEMSDRIQGWAAFSLRELIVELLHFLIRNMVEFLCLGHYARVSCVYPLYITVNFA